ncbi:uncharacterized protein [Macrobrachium rosenbergii]|uniref:uncharacterized protein isoform X1 n=1 Tax=Macrobrachium rosenbergii TaxID=79674 RepID=UPI0034D5AFE2
MFKERLSFKMAGEKSPMHFLDALSPMDPFYELLSMKYVDQNYDADPLGQRTVKPSSPLQNEPCREFVEEEEFDKPYSEGHDDTSVEGITDLQQPDGKAINESKLENVPDGTAVTTGQTEMGSRQFGDQCTTGQSNTNKSPNKTNYIENQVGSSLETVQNAKNCMEGALQVINGEGQHPQLNYIVISVGEFSKNQEDSILEISPPSTHIPKPTGSQEPPGIIYNPVSDGQPVNTDELRKDDRDLSQKRRVNPKRKTSDEDDLNKNAK